MGWPTGRELQRPIARSWTRCFCSTKNLNGRWRSSTKSRRVKKVEVGLRCRHAATRRERNHFRESAIAVVREKMVPPPCRYVSCGREFVFAAAGRGRSYRLAVGCLQGNVEIRCRAQEKQCRSAQAHRSAGAA